MKFALLLLSLLSVNAFVGPVSVAAPLRTSSPTMQQQPQEPPKAPKNGWTLTLAGGSRTVADVYKDQAKAAKSYIQKDEVEMDYKRTKAGWTTN